MHYYFNRSAETMATTVLRIVATLAVGTLAVLLLALLFPVVLGLRVAAWSLGVDQEWNQGPRSTRPSTLQGGSWQ